MVKASLSGPWEFRVNPEEVGESGGMLTAMLLSSVV
jgi:hypothetical protein